MIAASPAPAIAAFIVRERRRIAGHFFVHHAVTADEAVAYVPQSAIALRELTRMQKRGVIREAGAGRYWIDTAAYYADAERRRRILVPVVIVLVVAAAAAIMWAGFRG